MSDAVIIASLAAVVSIVQVVFTVRTKRSADIAATNALTNGEKADKAVVRADELMTKADEIHTATNGNLSVIKQELALARQEIASLKTARVLAKENTDAAVDAALLTPAPVRQEEL